MKIPELFMVLMEHFKEYAPLKGKGLVSKQIGEYVVKITADEETKDEDGWPIKPFRFHVFKDGWLVAVISPNGGEVLESIVTEDELIEAFKKESDIMDFTWEVCRDCRYRKLVRIPRITVSGESEVEEEEVEAYVCELGQNRDRNPTHCPYKEER